MKCKYEDQQQVFLCIMFHCSSALVGPHCMGYMGMDKALIIRV